MRRVVLQCDCGWVGSLLVHVLYIYTFGVFVVGSLICVLAVRLASPLLDTFYMLSSATDGDTLRASWVYPEFEMMRDFCSDRVLVRSDY